MKKIGIEIDYSNICKDYNTVYLDRDNSDPETKICMKKVMQWTHDFVAKLLENFDYNLYNLSSNTSVNIETIASKRFLFYSLEKEITLQSYVLKKSYIEYESLGAWEADESESILIQNDEDGGSILVFVNEDSLVLLWLKSYLKEFSLDEVDFEAR